MTLTDIKEARAKVEERLSNLRAYTQQFRRDPDALLVGGLNEADVETQVSLFHNLRVALVAAETLIEEMETYP